MSAGNSRVIPHFVSARSPLGLRRSMLLENLRLGRQLNWFSIQKDGERWIAWFYKEVELSEMAPQLAENVSPNG